MPAQTLIHIGAGFLQIPMIKLAKSLGFEVIVTDGNPSAPGIALADRFWHVDGSNVEQVLEKCKTEDVSTVVGIWCNNDYGIPAVAAVNELCDLEGVRIDSANKALNKEFSKEVWQTTNVRTPVGKMIETIADAEEFSAEVGYPIIVKPADSSGSRGVVSVSGPDALTSAFLAAQEFSDFVMVEELIIGDHVDVNGLFINGEFHRMGLIDRHFCEPPYTCSRWGCTPSALLKHEDDIYGPIERAARALGIDSGPIKADVIWSKGEAVILEVSPRFHGEIITAFTIPKACGINPAQFWFKHLLGGCHQEVSLSYNQTAGWHSLFAADNGVIRAVENIEEAQSQEGIDLIFLRKIAGHNVRSPRDNTDLCGIVWGHGTSKEEVDVRLQKAAATVRFDFDSSAD